MSLRRVVKKVPGARPTYITIMRGVQAIRRRVIGPNRGERYDLETDEVLMRLLKHDSSCIDLGAHYGEILKMMLKSAPDGKHLAIEAIPYLAERLTKLFPNVTVHSCAVGRENGESTFNHVTDRPAYSGLRERTYPRDDCEIRVITVPVRRLDDLVPPDFVPLVIKADIEGGEYDAFCGSRELIRRTKPYIVFEFAQGGAGCYGITPEMMYTLLHDEFGLTISTMRRWLDGASPLNKEQFAESFASDTDVYFMAYPESRH